MKLHASYKFNSSSRLNLIKEKIYIYIEKLEQFEKSNNFSLISISPNVSFSLPL